MAIWKFTLQSKTVRHGGTDRPQLTADGCNEPFKDRYWCPQRHWFMREACPFLNRHECYNFELMCGRRLDESRTG